MWGRDSITLLCSWWKDFFLLWSLFIPLGGDKMGASGEEVEDVEGGGDAGRYQPWGMKPACSRSSFTLPSSSWGHWEGQAGTPARIGRAGTPVSPPGRQLFLRNPPRRRALGRCPLESAGEAGRGSQGAGQGHGASGTCGPG